MPKHTINSRAAVPFVFCTWFLDDYDYEVDYDHKRSPGPTPLRAKGPGRGEGSKASEEMDSSAWRVGQGV